MGNQTETVIKDTNNNNNKNKRGKNELNLE